MYEICLFLIIIEYVLPSNNHKGILMQFVINENASHKNKSDCDLRILDLSKFNVNEKRKMLQL